MKKLFIPFIIFGLVSCNQKESEEAITSDTTKTQVETAVEHNHSSGGSNTILDKDEMEKVEDAEEKRDEADEKMQEAREKEAEGKYKDAAEKREEAREKRRDAAEKDPR